MRILETNKRITAFGFSHEQVRKINNLHKLFGVIVRFPFLRGSVDLLCSLPLGALYAMIFYFWYGYNIKFKIYPFTSWRNEFLNYVSLWWGLVRKT